MLHNLALLTIHHSAPENREWMTILSVKPDLFRFYQDTGVVTWCLVVSGDIFFKTSRDLTSTWWKVWAAERLSFTLTWRGLQMEGRWCRRGWTVLSGTEPPRWWRCCSCARIDDTCHLLTEKEWKLMHQITAFMHCDRWVKMCYFHMRVCLP